MSNRRTTSTTQRRPTKPRPQRHLLVLYGVLICLGIGILIAGQGGFGERADLESREKSPRKSTARNATSTTTARRAATATESARDGPIIIDDDGQTLWASPTDGAPLDVAYLPPGAQIIVALRPEAIADHPEGDKIIESLGPLGLRAGEFLDNDLLTPAGVKRAIIGCRATSDGEWEVTQVVRLSGGETASQHIAARLPNAIKKIHASQPYWLNGDRAYYVPDSGDGMTIVVAPATSLADIIDLGREAPPLRRDVERLLAETDADRHVTVVVTPNSLFSEGRSMFDGEMMRLREPLFWFLGDELSAAALSMHWDDDFFFELIATPTLDTSPEKAARILSERVREISDKLNAYVAQLDPHAYSREVVARFPSMIGKLAEYTRSGFESHHAVLRGYLPAVAGHNLLMASELTLAQPPAGDGVVASATLPSAASPPLATEPIRERLQRPTSMRFPRDTLEAALEQLGRDIGVEITIRGPDLQADGITRNQSFGIDLDNKPAQEILVEILRLANPDKTAAGPEDARQKLVYVIGAGPNGTEQIIITTRTAATQRGDELPPVFKLK